MWVAPSARGLGLRRRLLRALEQEAATSNPVVHLETNASLQEAMRLYRSSGYAEVAPFNEEAYAQHWFDKHLTAGASRVPHHSPGPDRHRARSQRYAASGRAGGRLTQLQPLPTPGA